MILLSMFPTFNHLTANYQSVRVALQGIILQAAKPVSVWPTFAW